MTNQGGYQDKNYVPGDEDGGRRPAAPADPLLLDFETLCDEFADKDLAAATLLRFLLDAPQRLDRLRSAIERGDREAVRFEAHKLSGAAATLEAVPLQRAAKWLEKRSSDADAWAEGLERLRGQFDALRTFVESQSGQWKIRL
jgi:HPt (histidine-containing phosphotransfer) domain-containing protein